MAVQRRRQLRGRADRANDIGEEDDPTPDAPTDAFVPAQHRMNDGCGQQPERAEAYRRNQWKWTGNAELWKDITGQRAQVPDQTENRRQHEERVECSSIIGTIARADDHCEQHRVERYARAETDEIQQLAKVHGRHAMRLQWGCKPEPGEWLFLANEWLPRSDGGGLPLIVSQRAFAPLEEPLVLFRSSAGSRFGTVPRART